MEKKFFGKFLVVSEYKQPQIFDVLLKILKFIKFFGHKIWF